MPAKVTPPPVLRKIVRQRRGTVASRPAIALVLAPKVNIAEPILGPLVPDLDMARAPPSTLNLQPSTQPSSLTPQLSALNPAQLVRPESDRLRGNPSGPAHAGINGLLVRPASQSR
jgi:hypothetical protein